LKHERAKEVRRIRKLGVWGCGIAKDGVSIYESFTWGFVGDDFISSGYDSELIETLREMLDNPAK
jgi:hypothetical protein